jgi:hypothetical protein
MIHWRMWIQILYRLKAIDGLQVVVYLSEPKVRGAIWFGLLMIRPHWLPKPGL